MGKSPVPGNGVQPADPPPIEGPTPALAPIAFKKAETPPPLEEEAGEEVAGTGRPPVAPANDGGYELEAAFR